MKFYRALTVAAAMAVSIAAVAEDPNINPGIWETTSTVTIQSEQIPIPPRTDTSSECVTAEKIAEGQAFLEDSEDCEFTNKDMRADGMDYSMVCNTPDGGKVNMNASMQFGGDTMSGTIDGDIESPMGLMSMNVEMSGERSRDCTPEEIAKANQPRRSSEMEEIIARCEELMGEHGAAMVKACVDQDLEAAEALEEYK